MTKLIHHGPETNHPNTLHVDNPRRFEGPHDRESVLVGARVMKLLGETMEEARTDELTGLPNKRGFEENLKELITKAEVEDDASYSFLFIDLDNFKEVNDTHEDKHEAGDRVLKSVADILSLAIGPRKQEGELIGRLGGDEFGVVINTSALGNTRRNTELTTDEVEEGFIRRVEKSVADLATAIGMTNLGVSIGAVKYRKGETAESFKKRADNKMYEMKKAKKGEQKR